MIQKNISENEGTTFIMTVPYYHSDINESLYLK